MDTTAWYEFPFVDDEAGGEPNVVARLTTLLDIATKLEVAAWPTRLTVTGLAFRASEQGAGDELLRLGVEEPFTGPPGRTLADVCEGMGRLHDVLRQRGLDVGECARLHGLYWILGLDTSGAQPGGLATQVDAASA